MFTYPTLTDNLSQYVGLVSTFWTQLYGGANLVFDYLRGCMASQQQLNNDIDELVATIGRKLCPVYHNELWYNVDLLESQVTQVMLPAGGVTFPWPATAAQVNHMTDAIIKPTVMMTNGIDFNVNTEAGTILFPFNPFTDTRFSPLPVFNSQGVITDYSLPLWFLGAQIDLNYIYQQFGYVIGLNLPSGQNYKDLVVAILDGVSGATSYDNVAKAVSAIVDIPLVKSDGETIQNIVMDSHGLMIATDYFIYRFMASAIPVVAIGDTVNQDDSLVVSLSIFEPNRGGTPNISALTLSPSDFLDPTLTGPVTFNNASTALNVILNVSGYTEVTWALGGLSADVTNFFNLLHTKGIAAGKTLAMCMDTRPQPQSTQPTAANLPTTINPLVFLFQNAFRNNGFVVALKTADFGSNNLGLSVLSILRQIMPPHVAMIVVTT